jgi:hypothetical protein
MKGLRLRKRKEERKEGRKEASMGAAKIEANGHA